MARFFGSVHGKAGRATRLGSVVSGLEVQAAGWSGCVNVSIYADGDQDRFRVTLVPWQSSGGSSRVIAEGLLDATAQLHEAEYAPELCEDCASSFGPCYAAQVRRAAEARNVERPNVAGAITARGIEPSPSTADGWGTVWV